MTLRQNLIWFFEERKNLGRKPPLEWIVSRRKLRHRVYCFLPCRVDCSSVFRKEILSVFDQSPEFVTRRQSNKRKHGPTERGRRIGRLVALDCNGIKADVLVGLPKAPREKLKTGGVLSDRPSLKERLNSRVPE